MNDIVALLLGGALLRGACLRICFSRHVVKGRLVMFVGPTFSDMLAVMVCSNWSCFGLAAMRGKVGGEEPGEGNEVKGLPWGLYRVLLYCVRSVACERDDEHAEVLALRLCRHQTLP